MRIGGRRDAQHGPRLVARDGPRCCRYERATRRAARAAALATDAAATSAPAPRAYDAYDRKALTALKEKAFTVCGKRRREFRARRGRAFLLPTMRLEGVRRRARKCRKGAERWPCSARRGARRARRLLRYMGRRQARAADVDSRCAPREIGAMRAARAA